MNRRTLLQALGSSTISLPALAQAPRKRRIGMLIYLPNAPFERGFSQAMRDVGYVEGENLEVVRRNGQGRHDLLERAAAELVQEKVEVIVIWSTDAAEVARRATTTIPIVIQVADPLGSGLIKSLARPEANLTGTSSNSFGVAEKRVSLLIEALPGIRRVGFLGLKGEANLERFFAASKPPAAQAGAELHRFDAADTKSVEPAIAAAKSAGMQGLVLQQIFYPQNAEVAALTLRHRMPAISWQRNFTDAGGLIAYGAAPEDNYQRMARLVSKVLAGAKPADLPVEQATRTDLTVNLRTAKLFGLTVPPAFLGRADDVIE